MKKNQRFRHLSFWLIPGLLAGLAACSGLITEVSPDSLPDTSPKLVVNAFISPQDTLIVVRVTQSSPVYADPALGQVPVQDGEDYNDGEIKISDAIVTLTSATRTVTLRYDPVNNWYAVRPGSTTIRISPGQTYRLNVESDRKKAEAVCTVPLNPTAIDKISLDTSRVYNAFTRSFRLTARMAWNSDGREPVYYRIKGFVDADVKNTGTGPGVKHVINLLTFDDETLQKNESGTSLSFSATGIAEYRGEPNEENNGLTDPRPLRFNRIYLELLTVDEGYYRYHESIRRNSRDDDNPFAEPTQVYNNIRGGLGCFAASNKTQRTLRQNDIGG